MLQPEVAVAEPLRQSGAMAELSKKLGLLERVRHVCNAVAIPLPGVVVVGEQSAGKSSLLENISGVQFPRAQNTCTRMPCILTMLTDPAVAEPRALVSMNSAFSDAQECPVSDVEAKIKSLTDEHAQGDCFISRQPLYIRVIRSEGPQLSLIDLPGVTHNASQMKDIHEVTTCLVEEYIKQEEVVILCVIPAASDFGNAEVIKMAHKYDPDGKRTLGVVTKCDDASRAEVCDVVDKTLMRRQSDVRLSLGFHCVVNRSQRNIEEGLTRKDLWEKEQGIFEANEHLRGLPTENWGTLRLMEKIARIQEGRVDECLPKIKAAVRAKLCELRDQLRAMPVQVETEADQYRLFNGVIHQVLQDLQRRVRAEYVSSTPGDDELTIAPRVASMVQEFRTRLNDGNPDWLGSEMTREVEDTVHKFLHGYTVDNLMGPQVFVSLVKRVFVDDALLRDAARDLVDDIAEHLKHVISHLVDTHTATHSVLATHLTDKAHDVIEELQLTSRQLCDALAESQQVTSTTHGGYMVKLTGFRKSWVDMAVDVKDTMRSSLPGSVCSQSDDLQLPDTFVAMIQQARTEPQKLAVLEICASLHVYSDFLIGSFVDMTAKLAKFNMVEKLSKKLEEDWRADVSGDILKDLFPKDERGAQQQRELQEMMKQLQEFKEQLAGLRISTSMRPPGLLATRRAAPKSVKRKHET